jgi:hypothetical protein
MRPLRFALILATLVTASSLCAADGDGLRVRFAKLKPSEGWTETAPPRVAIGNGLFELIDGGAELYQEFGFREAISWTLSSPTKTTIQVELYQMTDPAAAFGQLSLMQSGKYTRGELGQGSLRFSYYLTFWSGPFFVSVTGSQADAATQAEVDKIGNQLALDLPRTVGIPKWFALLPPTGLEERKYFRGPIGLSNIQLGEVAQLFTPKLGIVGIYPGCKVLMLHLASAADATAQVEQATKTAAARPTITGIKSDASGFTCMDGERNRISVLTRDRDLYAFVYTDDAAYRAVLGQP